MKGKPLPVKPITPREAAAWRRKYPPIRFRPGQVLFYRGHLPYGILIVHSGSADLRTRETDRKVRFRVGPNNVLGLANLADEEPYSRTAVVVEEMEASFVGKTAIRDWIRDRDEGNPLPTPSAVD